MQVNFKVYPRKIDIYYLTSTNQSDILYSGNSGLYWKYLYSSNAYKTCKAAVIADKLSNPLREYKAKFSY